MPKQTSIENLENELAQWKNIAIERGEEIDELCEENAELRSQIPKPDYDDGEKFGCWREDPSVQAERTSNSSPFDRDEDIKDWARRQFEMHGEDADLNFEG